MHDGLHWLTLCQGPQPDSERGGCGPGDKADAPEIAVKKGKKGIT